MTDSSVNKSSQEKHWMWFPKLPLITVAYGAWLTEDVASNSLKSSFGCPCAVFSAICGYSSLSWGEKIKLNCDVVKVVTFSDKSHFVWQDLRSATNSAPTSSDSSNQSGNRSTSYRETKSAGRGTFVWATGPAAFLGLSLRRGSNLRYKDCFLNADSLNCWQ